jgi:uncharacterized protein
MPRGDGTGPVGTGPMTGKAAGRGGIGAGMGQGTGAGRGRMSGRCTEPTGECLCPRCGEKLPHQPGVPCLQQKCPKCGTPMVRN